MNTIEKSAFRAVFTTLATVSVAGCVVTEREVIVEVPVEVPVYVNSGTQMACARPQTGNQLTMRGSAGANLSLPAASRVVAFMGMGLGPGMTLDERQLLENKVQTVLETSSDGAKVRWASNTSAQNVDFIVSETQNEFRRVTVARGEEVGRMPESLAVEPATYRTVVETPLRPTPSPTSRVGGENVPAGSIISVIGRVRGVNEDSWFLIAGPDGTAYGYVEPAHVQPFERSRPHARELYTRVTGKQLRDVLDADVRCRTLSYKTALGADVFRACRDPGGRWIAEPPVGGATGSCSPVNPPFLLDSAATP